MAALRDPGATSPLTLCPNGHSIVECSHCSVRSLSVCSALDADELAALDKLARHVGFEARSTLFEQDEMADSVFNITAGSVRLYKLLPDGRRQIVGFALPGDFLGLSMSDRNAFSADALSSVSACQFSLSSFSDLLDAKPHLLRRLHSMATPAGSTAYNLSANGPILPLDAPLMALTPISAFRPRRWRGALLPDKAKVTIEVLEAEKRPVAAVADHFETRDVAQVEVSMDHGTGLVLLHDPGHSLDERILREQFGY